MTDAPLDQYCERRTEGDGTLELREVWVTGQAQIVLPHSRSNCDPGPCVVHNPTNHHMRDWPTLYRFDRGMTERTCPHGIGHPDPDDPSTDTVHGCDGCCTPPEAA